MRAFAGFLLHELRSSVFALGVFLGLALSHLPLPLARYDFLLLWCLALQAAMILSGRERGREIAIVAAFHGLGLGLEAYKVRHGSWSYPEPAVAKILDVPLYSGFMYASVASYMLQADAVMRLRFERLPSRPAMALLLAAIYGHFLVARAFGGVRWLVVGSLLLAFGRTRVAFDYGAGRARMPLPAALALIGLFVFFAENLCTGLGAWVYPHQAAGWRPVESGKIAAWTLMATVAFLGVAFMGGFAPDEAAERRTTTAWEPA